MKKIKTVTLIISAALFATANAHAITLNSKAIKDLKASFVAKPCTVIVTGNLHTKRSGCKTGLGGCIKVVIELPGLKIDPVGERIKGTITIDPREPGEVVIDFLYLDDEQMNESVWDLEEDLVIDDPALSEEPGGYKTLTLLKGNYEIDRSENKIGRCSVRSRIEN